MADGITLIGHVTRDIVRFPQKPERRQPGGAVYYAGMALRALGQPVTVITRVAEPDEDALLGELRRAGAQVLNLPSAQTTCFVNTYGPDGGDDRTQEVTALADPFDMEAAAQISRHISGSAVYFGPLTVEEMPSTFIAQIAGECAATTALDVQGIVRRVIDGQVLPTEWPQATEILPLIKIVKADQQEAEILTNESDPERAALALNELGARHALVTMGGDGSVISRHGTARRQPDGTAFPIMDTTGCGDTFLAAYLYRIVQGAAPDTAGNFAATAATLMATHHGPLTDRDAVAAARSSD